MWHKICNMCCVITLVMPKYGFHTVLSNWIDSEFPISKKNSISNLLHRQCKVEFFPTFVRNM